MCFFGRAREPCQPANIKLDDGVSFIHLAKHGENGGSIHRLFWRCSLTKGEVVAIDGKTLRRSFDKAAGQSAIHMVSAWACANGVSLGQVKVDDKSNEITAVPKLLDTLCIAGCIVTLDAMGCQREICEAIIDGNADYTIAVKGNQEKLFEDVKEAIDRAKAFGLIKESDELKTSEKGHGREEIRRYVTIDVSDEMEFKHNWPGLTSIGLVKSTRIIDGKASYEDRYYIGSYSADVAKFSKSVRQHWQVENSLHWVLDVNFNDDDSRVRKGNGPENLSTIRRIAINMLKSEPRKESIRGKQLLCAHKPDYLLKVLIS